MTDKELLEQAELDLYEVRYKEAFNKCQDFWGECIVHGHGVGAADYRAKDWWDRFGYGGYPPFIEDMK